MSNNPFSLYSTAANTLRSATEDTEPLKQQFPAVVTRKAPSNLLGHDGRPQYGYFDGLVANLAAPDGKTAPSATHAAAQSTLARAKNSLTQAAQTKAPLRQLELVMLQHQHYQLLLRQCSQTLASYLLVFDLVQQKSRRIMPNPLTQGARSLTTKLADNGVNGVSDCGLLRFSRHDGDWQIALTLAQKKLQLQGEVKLLPAPLSLPMVSCGALGQAAGCWSYQQQHHGLTPVGALSLNHEPQVLSRMTAGYSFFANQTATKHPWCWLLLNADIDGAKVGLTLVDGLATAYPGNSLWLDGARHILPPCQLVADSDNDASMWQISSATEQVIGHFRPSIVVNSQGQVGKHRSKVLSGYVDMDIQLATRRITLREVPVLLGVEH